MKIRKLLAGLGVAAFAAASAVTGTGLVTGAAVGAGVVAAGVAADVATAPEANAHHNYYQAVRVSTASVSAVRFRQANGYEFYRGPSSIYSCCWEFLSFHVGPGHDAIVTSAEYPGWSQRLEGGWYTVPRLASPGHITIRVVNG